MKPPVTTVLRRAAACALAVSITWSAMPAAAEQALAVTIRNHRFEPAELTATAGEKIVLTVTNADAAPEEFDSPDLNREKLIRPGQTVTITLPALKPGGYLFSGEFNPTTATGRLVVK